MLIDALPPNSAFMERLRREVVDAAEHKENTKGSRILEAQKRHAPKEAE